MTIFNKVNTPSGYYVYAYIRSHDSSNAKAGSPYYIGKGVGNRAWDRRHRIPIPKDNKYILILSYNLTDIGALALERRLIRWYGRIDCSTGILHNLTDGGDGSGRSEITKQKLRVANLGKVLTQEHVEKIRRSNTGKRHSDATKKKLSDLNRGKSYEPRLQSTRDKISAALKGKPKSESHKAALCLAQQGRQATSGSFKPGHIPHNKKVR